MPLCKNCPPGSKKTYKGTEPSPKGLGYCGGCAIVGEIRGGKDGLMYIASKRKNGSVYWKKSSNQQKKVKKISNKTSVEIKKIINYFKKNVVKQVTAYNKETSKMPPSEFRKKDALLKKKYPLIRSVEPFDRIMIDPEINSIGKFILNG